MQPCTGEGHNTNTLILQAPAEELAWCHFKDEKTEVQREMQRWVQVTNKEPGLQTPDRGPKQETSGPLASKLSPGPSVHTWKKDSKPGCPLLTIVTGYQTVPGG